MSLDDDLARLTSETDRATSQIAAVYGDFYKRLRGAGMTEEQAYELTRDWMAHTAPAQEAADDD